MANVKITGLPALTTPATADLLEIVDDVAGTPTSKKITIADLLKSPGPIGGTAPGTGAFTTLTASSFINGAYATVASHATTSAIWAAAGNVINFTGTETITDFPAAAQAGSQRFLICAGATIFTHAGNITVQGGVTYTASAGDIVFVTAISTTTFKINILPQDGIAIKTEVSEDTTPQLGGDLDGQGNYAVDLQNFPDMLSNGPGYWFDGVDDYIDLGDTFQSTYQNSFTVITSIKQTDGQPSSISEVFGAYNAAVEDLVTLELNINGTLEFAYFANGNESVAITSTAVFSDGQEDWSVLAAVVDKTIGSYGQIYLYKNGKELTLAASPNDGDLDTNSVVMGDFATAENSYFGCRNAAGSASQFMNGEGSELRLFNLALTAAEVKAFSNGAAIPY
jgi:hypothetical protein